MLGSCNISSTTSDNGSAAVGQQGVIDDLMSEAADDEKIRIKANTDRIQTMLQDNLNKALENPQYSIRALSDRVEFALGQLDNFAGTIASQKNSIEEADAELANATEQTKGYKERFAHNQKMRLLETYLEMQAHEKFVAAALKSDSVVAAATERWKKLPAPKISLARIASSIELEPCTFGGAKPAANAGKFTLRGVPLGISRNAALQAVCADTKSDTRMTQLPSTAMSFLEAPENLAYLRKPYVSNVKLCFGCKLEQTGRVAENADKLNGMWMYFSPDDRLTQMVRNQRFEASVTSPTANGGTAVKVQGSPQPLKTLLAPLEQKWGNPSVLMEFGANTLVGWVFPDGKTAITPQETWFSKGWQGTTVLQFRVKDRLYPNNQAPDRAWLATQKPKATYCLVQWLQIINEVGFGNADLFRYDERQRSYDLIKERYAHGPKYSDDDARYDPVGLTKSCGTLVTAHFKKVEGDLRPLDQGSAKTSNNDRIDPDAPVYSVKLNMVDTAALTWRANKEMQQIASKLATRTSEVKTQMEQQKPTFVP